MAAPRILTVCTGNVCRSPLLERLLQRGLDEAYGAGAVEVISAGTGALVDHPMDERSAAVLARLGGDPTGFVARHLVPREVASADLIITATREHRALAVRAAPRALRRAFTLGELAFILEHLGPERWPTAADPGERIEQLTSTATEHRGQVRPASWDDFDLADPYRRADAAYEELERAVRRDLPPVLRALGADPGLP